MGVIKKSVAMQMGWSSVAFMLENYARFLPGWGDNGAMDKALSCGPRTLSPKSGFKEALQVNRGR